MRMHTTDTYKQSRKPGQLQANFGRVSKYSKLIREAFHKQLFNLREEQLECRFFSRVFDALRKDGLLPVGSRKMTACQLELLEGFEFNNRKRLPRIFNGSFNVSIDRRKGICNLEVPAFDPIRDLRWKGRVTHIKILAAVAVLDFRSLKYRTFSEESGFLDVQQLIATTFPITLPARTRRPIVVVMGIEFYQFVGSRYFLRQQDGAKSLTIVKVV
jgi:hypothetical protein